MHCKDTILRTQNNWPYSKLIPNSGIDEKTPSNIDVFTIEERDSKKRKVRKTYIYDKVEKYVIVLEQQRSNAFYLLTAYHLNKEYGEKALLKKMKKRIATPL